MSGGEFNYEQHAISRIADDINRLIVSNNSTATNEWGDVEGNHYPPEIIAEFDTAVTLLRTAFVYAQRIDYLVSGDDGQDSFLSRLAEELAHDPAQSSQIT